MDVDRTKGQIKDSPEYDPETFRDEVYREKLGDYYHETYGAADYGPTSTSGAAPEQEGDLPR